MRLTSARAQRWMKAGSVVSSVPFFLLGVLFIRTGVLFFFAPELLREEEFRQDAPFGVSLLGLSFLGGTGLLAWCGWRLTRLARRGLDIVHATAFWMIGIFWKHVFGDGDASLFNLTGLGTSLFSAGYLSIPSVRSLFRAKGGPPGGFAA